MDIAGRIAVVTGAAAGTGRIIADALAERGARVVVVDVDAEQAVAAATALGDGALSVAADLSVPTGVDDVLAALDAVGEAQILVNCAGGWGTAESRYPQADEAQWQAVLHLNLTAAMTLTQRLLPGMTATGAGAVVNISSSAGIERTPYGSPEYAVAKAGLIRFSTALGGQRDLTGVRVNCVVPHWIGLERAEQQKAQLPESERAAAPALVPPRLVADTTLRFVEDDGLTGQVCVLEGGAAPYFVR